MEMKWSRGDIVRFVYCYDEDTKKLLISLGYTFMNEEKYKGRFSYRFINDGKKTVFNNNEVEFSNRLYC